MAGESRFQASLIREIRQNYPGAVIIRPDSGYLQGIPDRLILYRNKWAAFECKADEDSGHRTNQDYYINLLDKMSYASFVYPENKERFLHELQQTFRSARSSRISFGV
jgi:hypothetical protein